MSSKNVARVAGPRARRRRALAASIPLFCLPGARAARAQAPPPAAPPARAAAAPAAPAARGLLSDVAGALGLVAPGSRVAGGYREQFGAGLGGHAGYVVRPRLYVGATFAVEGPALVGLEVPASPAVRGLVYAGPAVGVDLRAGPAVVVRPYLAAGLGVALARATAPGGGFAVWPGLSLAYLFRHVALGADLRPAALAAGAPSNFCALGTFGVAL